MLGVPDSHVHHHRDDLEPGISLHTASQTMAKGTLITSTPLPPSRSPHLLSPLPLSLSTSSPLSPPSLSPGHPAPKGVGPFEGGHRAQLALSALRCFHQPPKQSQVLGERHRHLVHGAAGVVDQIQEVRSTHLQLPRVREGGRGLEGSYRQYCRERFLT